MAFGRPRRKRAGIEITSLIDVVFMLMIFFVVTTTFARRKALEIDLPEAKEGKEIKQQTSVIEVARDGRVSFDGEVMDLSQVQARVREAVSSNDVKFMTLKVDQGTPYGQVLNVQEALQEAGLKGFYSQVDQAKGGTGP